MGNLYDIKSLNFHEFRYFFQIFKVTGRFLIDFPNNIFQCHEKLISFRIFIHIQSCNMQGTHLKTMLFCFNPHRKDVLNLKVLIIKYQFS
jgi:hypothetical protein